MTMSFPSSGWFICPPLNMLQEWQIASSKKAALPLGDSAFNSSLDKTSMTSEFRAKQDSERKFCVWQCYFLLKQSSSNVAKRPAGQQVGSGRQPPKRDLFGAGHHTCPEPQLQFHGSSPSSSVFPQKCETLLIYLETNGHCQREIQPTLTSGGLWWWPGWC